MKTIPYIIGESNRMILLLQPNRKEYIMESIVIKTREQMVVVDKNFNLVSKVIGIQAHGAKYLFENGNGMNINELKENGYELFTEKEYNLFCDMVNKYSDVELIKEYAHAVIIIKRERKQRFLEWFLK